MTSPDFFVTEAGLRVRLPSGAETKVMVQEEVAYVTERSERYLTDNHFYNISDVQDVDRMVILELQCWRIGNFLNRGGKDYFNKAIDEAEARRSLTAMSNEIRQLKKILRIDKNARDSERGENSVSAYIENLRRRAEEFGVHRDRQVAKVLELGMQLIALATYHGNCNDEERRELGITVEDLYQWIRDVFTVEMLVLDRAFRQNQKMWVRDL